VLIESAVPMDAFDPRRVDGAAVRAELGIPVRAPVAGTVNRFAYPKEPQLMLEAARRILEARPDAHFIFVGDGPLRDKTLACLGDLPRHPRLHMTGVRQDVPPLVAAMDVFLLSSKVEGMPRAAVEALALGKPVVSTPAGGVGEIVVNGKTGFLVPHGDAVALSENTLRLLGDPEQGRALGAEGSRRVRKRFDVRLMVERISALYEQLLEEHAGRTKRGG
jgi:L-malate glycosyltransferase